MNKNILYLLILTVLIVQCRTKSTNSFVIDDKSSNANIYLDERSDDLVKWAANDLSGDLEKITGRQIKVSYTDQFHPDKKGIYIGKFDDGLMENLPEQYTGQLKGKWEKFIVQKQRDNLFIVGSDIRGTVYGIFDVAERMGISPWKWWADVHPEKKGSVVLTLPPQGIEESPSVQYRGIFLNDEDWGLQPWAAQTFEPETGDIGPKTYEKIFQLLLRLKANTIWPAMHPSTKAFFTIPGNKEMAEKYHISIGTSHAEPMLRNNVGEWNEKEYGEFNYFTNAEKVREYWQERISETKNGDNIISLGMRGVHDSGMEGDATLEEKTRLLETIIADQRKILTQILNKPIDSIPQVLVPYKEVLELYNNDLKVPDDVTLMWTDDNYGYIRRLSNKTEQKRKGGSGVYYHLSYWGRPHDYLWLSTTQPGLIWYEFTRAYQNGAQKIWIANVGDIKPAEYDMEFFLDLAWDINSINENSINEHLVKWCAREFGEGRSEQIATIMQEYYRLAFLRRPEFMGWSRTEPQTPTSVTEFNDDEARRRIEAYAKLVRMVDAIKPAIPPERADAYFELVEYPVKSAALMNRKFLYAQQSLFSKDMAEKEKLAHQSQKAFDEIVALTGKYNHSIGEGKWNKIMSMNPRNLAAYAMPTYHLTDTIPIEKHALEKDQKPTPIFIQASEFSEAKGDGNYQWKAIDGLGYSDASVTLFPFENHVFSQEEPFLEYTFNINEPGKYMAEVRFLPTHSNNFDHKVRIEVNGREPKEYSINTKGRSEAWKENVLRNFASVSYPFTIDKKGKQTLKIQVNQTGIVIDQIAISAGDDRDYYEIVK